MSLAEMQDFKDWDLKGLEFDGSTTVYERYARVPRAIINDVNGKSIKDKDWDDMVMAMSIVVPAHKDKAAKEKDYNGSIVFIEEITEIPYQECHWDKQDGRWLGVGEIENQFENQVIKNLTTNLRNRSLLWASKKLFQSTDEAVKQNLVKETRDGQVLTVAPGGQITQVNTQNQNLGEFQSMDNVVDKNSDQISFTYEVATGESLPSGTPLGLGVLLSGATKKHFKLKQQDFGLFLEKTFFKLLIPIFKKQTRDHTIAISSGEQGIENLKNAMIEIKTNQHVIDSIIAGKIVDYSKVKTDMEQHVMKSPYFFLDIPDGFYDDAQMHMELDLVGEARNAATEVQDYQFLYTAYAQKGDPRADAVLDLLAAKKGINLTASIGRPKPAAPVDMSAAPGLAPKPSINNLQTNGPTQ